MEKVTYPDGREIYYNYEAGAQFRNLGRVANIADCDSDDPADANTYAAYAYLGAGMIVDADHLSLSRRAGAVPAGRGENGDWLRSGKLLAAQVPVPLFAARALPTLPACAWHGRDAHATRLHDPAGNNTFGPKATDDANAMHCTYDAWNRLSRVYLDDGDDANELDANDTLLATYRYDGLNRRVNTVTDVDGNSVTDYTFFNTSWQAVEIRRGEDGNAPSSDAYKQYCWDIRYIDAPVCRWWDADLDGQMEPADGEHHYYTQDAQYNTTALVDANSGDVVERYLYDPYGRPTFLDANWTPIAASAYDNEILYCGYRYDAHTGLYYVRNRYQNGRIWLTRDKSGYVDGMSLYEYVKSSPLTLSDSWGAQAKSTAQPTTQSAPVYQTLQDLGRSLVTTTSPTPMMGKLAHLVNRPKYAFWQLDETFFDQYDPVGVTTRDYSRIWKAQYSTLSVWRSNKGHTIQAFVASSPWDFKGRHLYPTKLFKVWIKVNFPGGKTPSKGCLHIVRTHKTVDPRGLVSGTEWQLDEVLKNDQEYQRDYYYTRLIADKSTVGRKRADCIFVRSGDNSRPDCIGCVYYGWSKSDNRGTAKKHIVTLHEGFDRQKVGEMDLGYPSKMRIGPPLGEIVTAANVALQDVYTGPLVYKFTVNTDIAWATVEPNAWKLGSSPIATSRYTGAAYVPVYKGLNVNP